MSDTPMKATIRLIQPSIEVLTPLTKWYAGATTLVEQCGRTCYKSERSTQVGSAEPFIKKVARQLGHTSILDHICITVRFIGSRNMSHQLVRHRIGGFAQESQRFCDYSKGDAPVLQVVMPPSVAAVPEWMTQAELFLTATDCVGGRLCNLDYAEREISDWFSASTQAVHPHQGLLFIKSALRAYADYLQLRSCGVKAEDARYLLPSAAKTEICATFDVTQWRHVLKTRCDKHAQWEIRALMQKVLWQFIHEAPVFFSDMDGLLPA